MTKRENKITVRDDDQTKSALTAGNQVLSSAQIAGLLSENDPAPVVMLHGQSSSPFLLVADHAGRAIPAALGDLGLSESDRRRHIAWDIGVDGTARRLADALEAALIAQRYSRLVIDCNRRPGHPTSVAPSSDWTDVPGNQGLSDAQRRLRERDIFEPYHGSIAALLEHRRAQRQDTVLVALHSFTPRMKSADRPDFGPPSGERPWHAGVLYNRDPRFARILRDLLQRDGDLVVGDNEPYALSDLDDYTVPVHAERRGLPHVEIEIRQDLISDAAGESSWAALLTRLLPEAWDRFRAAHS